MIVLKTQGELRKTKHEVGVSFLCGDCGEVKPVQTSGGTGYGYIGEGDSERPICYVCCGKRDLADMIETGRATLYLTCEPASKACLNGRPYTPATINRGAGRRTTGRVSNWAGSLLFACHTQTGRHNIAGVRYDCWFNGPDGFRWHGVTYGDNTQICHCRRTKERI